MDLTKLSDFEYAISHEKEIWELLENADVLDAIDIINAIIASQKSFLLTKLVNKVVCKRDVGLTEFVLLCTPAQYINIEALINSCLCDSNYIIVKLLTKNYNAILQENCLDMAIRSTEKDGYIETLQYLLNLGFNTVNALHKESAMTEWVDMLKTQYGLNISIKYLW